MVTKLEADVPSPLLQKKTEENNPYYLNKILNPYDLIICHVDKNENETLNIEKISSLYRLGTVNSNTVNSKFHLIQSFCEMLSYHFMFKIHC